jgi:hypothetical protein
VFKVGLPATKPRNQERARESGKAATAACGMFSEIVRNHLQL